LVFYNVRFYQSVLIFLHRFSENSDCFITFAQSRAAGRFIMERRKGGTRHIERRLLRFGFDVLKSWKNFKYPVRNKAA
jgi:hypothetical protein